MEARAPGKNVVEIFNHISTNMFIVAQSGDSLMSVVPSISHRGEAMIHSLREKPKVKAIAEVLAMIADAHPDLAAQHRCSVPLFYSPGIPRQANGCGRVPPNFAPRWTAMQESKRTNY